MAVHTPVNGTTAIPWKTSRKKLSLLDRMRGCEEAWCPKGSWGKEEAHAAIRGTPPGTFLVLRDTAMCEPSLLCVSTADQQEPVIERDVQKTGKALQLSGSHLCFANITQLVLFYSYTRDVLPVSLSLPHWVYHVTENTDYPSPLSPKMWLSAHSEQKPEEKSNRGPPTLMCSIQTSSNGPLCMINPLYVHEHGDKWLQTSQTHSTVSPSHSRRDTRRLSTTRQWSGAGLHNKRAVSLEQESPSSSNDNTGLVRVRSADFKSMNSAHPVVPSGVVLRRPSRESTSPISLHPSPAPSSTPSPSDEHHSSVIPQSPHRVSWIEDGVWLPPPKPSFSIRMPSLELDSLSVSSIEEEQDPQTPTSSPHASSSQSLADKMKNRFSAVGQVLGGLVSPKKRLNNRVQEMSERKGGEFAEGVKVFVEKVSQKSPEKDGLTEFLQEVRSSLTTLRETLLDHTEIQVLLDSMTDLSDAEIDTLVERSLHKVALKPLSSHLYGCIQTSRSGDGTLDRLMSNQPRLEPSSVEQLGGSSGVGVPDAAALEQIQNKWEVMHKAYSPNKKVQVLLKVCKSIYQSMSSNSNNTGAVFGADDFLPCLTWVLLRSDVITLQVDIDYMMELLDPTQLQGEGGYYLTTLYAALYYISSYKPRLAARQLSVEAQQSLNQWHRRRTLHCERSRRRIHRQTIRRQSHSGRTGDTGLTTVNSCDDDSAKEVKQEPGTLREVDEESERNGVSDEEEKAEMVNKTKDFELETQKGTRTDTSADIQS